MNKIEVKILNPEVIKNAQQMMVTAARLTQRGHKINTLDDFMNLYNRDVKEETVKNMLSLSHSTIKRFGVINVVIIGASRRFLAQITRTQVGVTFMSGSLQYSDYSDKAQFVVPYHLLDKSELKEKYIESCFESMEVYKELTKEVGNDEAGYVAPQGLRNVLIISANPLTWMHMIQQRICNRNTLESQYVLGLIWKELYKENPLMFSAETCAPPCAFGKCTEGKMTCGRPYKKDITPDALLKQEFPIIFGEN